MKPAAKNSIRPTKVKDTKVSKLRHNHLTMVSSHIIVSGIIGYILDSWLRTSPAFMVLGIILGFIAMLYRLNQHSKL